MRNRPNEQLRSLKMGKGAQNQNLHQRRRKKKLSKKRADWKFWLLIKVNNLVHGQRDSKSTDCKSQWSKATTTSIRAGVGQFMMCRLWHGKRGASWRDIWWKNSMKVNKKLMFSMFTWRYYYKWWNSLSPTLEMIKNMSLGWILGWALGMCGLGLLIQFIIIFYHFILSQ